MNTIIFASNNENKFNEIRIFLIQYDIKLNLSKLNLPEIQSDSLEEIASKKADFAFDIIRENLIVEDTGLFIDALNSFPGPYSSYVLRTIGNSGILDLLSKKSNRCATFKSVVAFSNGKLVHMFVGEVRGTISNRVGKKGWGYDPIFIPANQHDTYGEIGARKIEISHRAIAMRRFINWYSDHYPSNK
jgi:XTP/dITP diphosphohydrolase